MDETAAGICRRHEQLKAERAPHEPVWGDCCDYTFPLRSQGFNRSNDSSVQSASDRRARLLDGTGTDSGLILASGVMSGVTPANSRWFGMEMQGAQAGEKRWLDESADILWRNIHAANFDAAAFEAMLDVVAVGWFVLFIDELEQGGLNFETWPVSQCYLAASRAGGPADICHRDYEYTAEQALREFGEACSADTRKLAAEKPDTKVQFVHAIYPRRVYGVGPGTLAKNMPYASCHVEVKSKVLVRESGFHELPIVVPRWMTIPGSVYAVGPAFNALPDMRMLNEIKRMELAAAELAIAGMWIAEDDGVLNPRAVKVGPKKIIVANSVESMKALETGSDFNVAFTQEERLQRAIRKVFMADQLQPQDGPAMTATEVHVRVALIRQLLGPVYGRLQAEYLQPMITRVFGLALRANALPPMPDSLRGREITVKYISPMARAQSLEDISAMDQFEAVLLNESEVEPTILDNYDFDQAVRTRAQLLGVPAKLTRDPKAVAALRQARTDAQAQQQMQQTAAVGMEAFAQTAGENAAAAA